MSVHLVLGAACLLALGITALLIPRLRRAATQRGWVDQPDEERKVHKAPIPTIGGLAIFSGFAVSMLVLQVANATFALGLSLPPILFWVGALIMVGVGFVDDLRGLDFKHKLVFQIIAAYMLLHAGFRFELSAIVPLQNPYQEALYSIPLTLLWIVGIINAVNLIDGLDGLAGGVVLIGLASLAIVFGGQSGVGSVVIAVVMIGAIAGFLFFNFNPASVFMGDAGSLLLGFTLAAFSLTGQHYEAVPLHAIIVPVVALGLPVLDANLSILRRLHKGVAICAPDNDHIHHRLRARFDPRHTVIILYAVAALLGLFAILISLLPVSASIPLLFVTLLLAMVGLSALGYIRVRPLIYTIQRHSRLAALLPGHAATNMSPSTEDGNDRQRNNLVMSKEMHTFHGTTSGDGEASTSLPHIDYADLGLMVTEDSIVVAEDNLSAADVGGESVLLDPNSGVYYGLNEIGSSIFNQIRRPGSVGAIVQALTLEYEVEADRLKQDVIHFLQQLKDKNLVRVAQKRAA